MGALGDVTFADIARALGRYRPVVFTVFAILVLLWVLPNPNHGGGSAGTASRAGAIASVRTPAVAAGTEVSGASTDSAAVAGGTVGEPSAADVSGGGTLGSSSSSYSPPASFTSGGDSSSTYTYSPPSNGSSSNDLGGSTSSTTPGGDATLAIAAATWSTKTGAGTPLGTTGVPDGDLPVGTRLGSDDKHSFVRLRGRSRTLTLQVDAAGARAAINGDVKIQACQVTAASWAESPGAAFDAEPTWDATTCVAGTPSADGTTWTFSLSRFTDPADERGVALVPSSGAATDFQVTFKR